MTNVPTLTEIIGRNKSIDQLTYILATFQQFIVLYKVQKYKIYTSTKMNTQF